MLFTDIDYFRELWYNAIEKTKRGVINRGESKKETFSKKESQTNKQRTDQIGYE